MRSLGGTGAPRVTMSLIIAAGCRLAVARQCVTSRLTGVACASMSDQSWTGSTGTTRRTNLWRLTRCLHRRRQTSRGGYILVKSRTTCSTFGRLRHHYLPLPPSFSSERVEGAMAMVRRMSSLSQVMLCAQSRLIMRLVAMSTTGVCQQLKHACSRL